MKIDFAAQVDIGIKETNDDRVLTDGKLLNMNSCSGTVDTPAIAVVCDGCGGYSGGGIAAETVLELLSYENPTDLADVEYLARVLDNCHQAIVEKQTEMPKFSKMCATIAGCVFFNDSIIIFHSGDSRVYRYDRWGLARITKDHSVVQEMIDMGEITSEEALKHPKRNLITRCIGIEGLPPEVYVLHSPINPGEKYLLCSDGLWESVSESEIKDLLDSGLPLKEVADKLVHNALLNGSDDNISVCIYASQATPIVQKNKPFILD